MFQLLVAEDEEMIRNKILNNIDWKEHGFSRVFSASDGFEALEIARNNHIDIVITDIQMPGMSGIELIRELKRLHGRIRTIIITAYAEFEYAKESIKLSVDDFILKPFQSRDLLAIARRIVEEIVRERSELKEVESLRKQLRENRDALREKLFHDLIGNTFIGNVGSDLEYLGLAQLKDCDYFIAVVNINNFMDLIQGNDEEQKYICNLTLYSWAVRFLTAYETQGWNIVNYKIDQIVIIFHKDPECVISILEELIDRGAKDLGYSLSVGIGNKYRNPTDMCISYREACSAAMLSCIYGKGMVYFFNDINLGNTFYSKQLHILSNTGLYENIKIGALEEIKKDVVEIISQIKSAKLELEAVNTIVSSIILLSSKTVNELGYNIFDIMGESFSMDFRLNEINDLVQLEEWLFGFFFKVNEYIGQKRSNRNESLVAGIKDHIDANYHSNITLTGISKAFGISTGYLSSLFAEYTGFNFIDYLSNLRIQKAKSLLKNSDLRIYEIAEAVGYRDAYYFSAAFKKIVGINPSDYREKLILLPPFKNEKNANGRSSSSGEKKK
jgi:two-component system response regulator YesN